MDRSQRHRAREAHVHRMSRFIGSKMAKEAWEEGGGPGGVDRDARRWAFPFGLRGREGGRSVRNM